MKALKFAAVLLALAAPGFMNGCSTGKTDSVGDPSSARVGGIDMMLRLPDGTTIDNVNYEISNASGYENDGVVPVANSTSIQFQIGSIPAGTGYSVVLSATTSDGAACTSQPLAFDIVAGQTTSIMGTLRCGENRVVRSDAGNARFELDVVREGVACPEVDGLSVIPSEVLTGSSLSLRGYATTTSARFGWTVAPTSAGTFSAADAANTTFTCSASGRHTVTLTVSGAESCTPSTSTAVVTCTSTGTEPDAGLDSAVPDAAEPDAAEPDAAEPDAAVPDAAEPDAAEPDAAEPDATTPDAAEPDSTTPDAAEPDSTTPDAAEPDAAEPDAAEPDATTPDAAEPDATTPDAGPSDGSVGGACETCRNTNCRSFLGVDLIAGCFETINTEFGAPAGDPAFIQDCVNVVDCGFENNCAYTEEKAAAGCYCGSATIDACAATGPAADAPCAAEWRAATRTQINAEVQTRFTDLAYPAGWGYFLLQCDRDSCRGICTP